MPDRRLIRVAGGRRRAAGDGYFVSCGRPVKFHPGQLTFNSVKKAMTGVLVADVNFIRVIPS